MRAITLALLVPVLPAAAQDLPRIDVPQAVTVLMASTIEAGDQMSGVSGFALDADLDGDQDLIVEVATNPVGGNAFWMVPYLLRNTGGQYEIATRMDLNGFIQSVVLTDGVVTITSSVYQDSDPRCCPSGVEVRSFALR